MANKKDWYRLGFKMEGLEDLAKLQIALTKSNQKLKEAKERLKGQKEGSEATAKAINRLTAQTKVYKKAVDNGINSMVRQKTALNATAKASKKTGTSLAAMGLSMAGVTMAARRLVTFLTASVKEFAAFEKGVKNVTTLMSQDETNLLSPKLYEGVLDLSKEYGFQLQDINKAMFNAVSAGIKGGEALEFLGVASKLAMAGVTDLKSATLGLTTVLNAYNMETSEAQKVSEILFTTQKFGVTTVEELSKSLGVVVPFAAASGISLEELGAAIATTTRSGLDAAKTVTALRAAISQMQKPSKESADLFTKFGIPVGAAEMKAIGFTETLKRLNDVYKESPEAIEAMFGNVRGLTAIFSLAGENSDQFQEILSRTTDEIERAGNLTKGTTDLMDSMDTRLNQLSASWTDFKVALGDSEFFKELVREMGQSLTILSSDFLSFWDKINPFLSQDSTKKLHDTRKATHEANKALAEMYEIVDSGEDVSILGMFGSPDGVPEEEMARVKEVIDLAIIAQNQIEKSIASGIPMAADYSELINEYEDYLAGLKAARDADAQDEQDEDDALALQKKAWRENELHQRDRFNDETFKANLEFAKKEEKTAEDVNSHKLKLIQLELEFLEQVLNFKGISAEKEVEIRKRINALILKEQGLLVKEEEEVDRRALSVKAQLQKQALNAATNAAKAALDTRLANEQRAMAKRAAMLDQEASDGLINQREAAKEKDKLDREAFTKKKEHDKKAAMISFIQELMAIRIAAAANPLNPVTFGAAGISQYAIQAAIATAAFAANMATIDSQKFAKGGIVYGNSHAQGGEKFAVGGRVAELEGGEAVINKRSTAMFGGALSAMNVAGGGKSFAAPNLSNGGLIDYNALGAVIGKNTNVVLPVESLNKTQNRVKTIENSVKF